MALISVGAVLIALFGFAAKGMVPPSRADRYLAMLAGIASVGPLGLAMCVYYLLSSPAQNLRFIKWAGRQRWIKQPQNVDWTLFDASDPDYDVTTIRYLLAKPPLR